jgi:hypothetical protein
MVNITVERVKFFMEDITSYGEISSSHHKGEMTSSGFFAGLCLALAGLFFSLSGLYHIGVSLYPYWERVTLGALAEVKGISNFACFTVIATGRMFFGFFLVYLAMQMWDGRAGCRRLLLLIVLPVIVLLGSYISGISELVSNEVLTFSGVTSSASLIALFGSFILIFTAIVLSLLLGDRLRDSSTDTSWLKAIGYCVVLFIGAFLIFGELDVDEQNTALLANMPPFSLPDSGYKIIILDSVSFEYVQCMTVLDELEKACEKQNKIQEIKYDNFASIPRSARLVEIMEGNGSLQTKPVCLEGGKYMVDQYGKWTCTVHGGFNKERLERGKRLQALLNGEDVSSAPASDDNYSDYGDM